MNRLAIFTLCLITILFVSACSESEETNYQELGWEDLKPDNEKIDWDQLYPDEKQLDWGNLNDDELGQGDEQPSDFVDDWMTDEFAASQGLQGIYSGPPPQAFSVGVVDEMNKKEIRVPGFVVPVEVDSENLVTEFFLVPYFGACFHKPPPPPNQTIYVTSAEPIAYESIYDPVWVMGVIKTEQIGNDIATAAYTMDLHQIEPYDL